MEEICFCETSLTCHKTDRPHDLEYSLKTVTRYRPAICNEESEVVEDSSLLLRDGLATGK